VFDFGTSIHTLRLVPWEMLWSCLKTCFQLIFLREEQEPGSGVIISYSAVIHRKSSFQNGIICSSFSADSLRVPVVPVSTSTEFVSYRSSRETRAATVFMLSNPDFVSKMILLQNLHFDGER
jgi:hypothetical protein